MPFRIFALLAFAVPHFLLAQATLGPLDGLELSPYDLNRILPGEMAPDFRLQDQDGKIHQLSQYRGKNVVLIMYRGYWWGTCTTQLGQLKNLLDGELKQSTQILALSPDDVEGAKKMMERQRAEQGGPVNFPLLADPGHRVINRYGQLNPQLFKNASNPAGYVVPHPAVILIDRNGRVTWKYTNTDANVRATNEQILAALKAIETK
jgi:thioredoxin-dependent peroxiredoxin